MNKRLHKKNILAGAPQGVVLGPLLFLIYMYIYIYIYIYIVVLTSLCKILSHDTSIFSKAINSKKSEMGPKKIFEAD